MHTNKPNILIIMSDQHHAGVMGCAGDAIVQTPSLDRLARAGIRFTNAYCPFPLCGPSRMSFMTSRHPHEIRQWDNECELASRTPTFAHAFASGGYDTVLSGRMHFVGADQRHGFAERLISDVPPTAYITAGWHLDKVLGSLNDTCGMSRNGILKSGYGRTGYQAYDEAVTRATVAWLQQRGNAGQEKPFLLTVGYVTPHCPFVAPPDDFAFYQSRITPASLPRTDANLHPRNAERCRRFGTDPLPPRDAQWRTRVAYYGLTTFLDRQIGEVLKSLKQSGQAENTIIVYCSDHGEMLGEHGMWWKSTFYDGGCRVPLIVAWPGKIPTATSIHRNVSLIDIGTTLIELAGLDPLPGASGKSFSGLLDGVTDDWDDTVFAEDTLGKVCRMVRSGPWKYNHYHGMEPELFNLHDDPEERTSLAGQIEYGDVENRLRELVLRNWNPEAVQESVECWSKEKQRIADWVRSTHPPEPDPLWFAQPPENWVNCDTP